MSTDGLFLAMQTSANRHDRYVGSSFSWNPTEKKEEMFHPLSRFIVYWKSSGVAPGDTPDPADMAAYGIFRFEREDERNLLYW